MKITVDTQHDSFEDIKKVFHLLGSIIDKKGADVSTTSSVPVDTTNLMSMFANPDQKEARDTAPDFSSFLNLANKAQKKDDMPKVEFF